MAREMHFHLRVPKIAGDVIFLGSVAESIAMAKATAFGAAEFHDPTYESVLRKVEAELLAAAKGGQLNVCDRLGFLKSADEIIDTARQAGTYLEVARRATEPDWAALKEKYPKRETAGLWNLTGLDLGATVVDVVTSELLCLCATLKQLNDWGVSVGNSFSIDPNAPPWTDQRGLMGLPKITPKVGLGATADSGDDWQTKCQKIADELHAKDIAAGAWSSVSDIADRVALIAAERRIRGPQGQLTAGNILREALQGEKWNVGRKEP